MPTKLKPEVLLSKRKMKRCVGRMYTTNLSQGEYHCLHILLHHIPGATSYSDLKKSPDGIIHKTFKETALAFGLLESDDEWDQCLSEAMVSFMPKQLHSLFVTILIFGESARPEVLWEKYREVLGEDLIGNASKSHMGYRVDLEKDNEVLLLLQTELEDTGSCLGNFDLPTPDKYQTFQYTTSYPRKNV